MYRSIHASAENLTKAVREGTTPGFPVSGDALAKMRNQLKVHTTPCTKRHCKECTK